MDKTIEERRKLSLEAAELKLRLLEIKSKQQELKKQEKKKKMKESSPAPLKERKEIRKEVCLNNYNNKRRRGADTPASNQNIVVFHPYKPVDTTGAISLVEYERMKLEGKV